jgi:selenocysteine lyase/cysteine desulfurase
LGPDITIFSAQKYLAGPTCGILVGQRQSISAAAANLAGIGRGMKPTKEALFGLSAAILERDWNGLAKLAQKNTQRAQHFATAFTAATGYESQIGQGPKYGPYPRVLLDYGDATKAQRVAEGLLAHAELIAVGKGQIDSGIITIELTHVSSDEEARLLEGLAGESLR